MKDYISVHNLEVFFTCRNTRIKVLDNICFSLQKGTVLTILGESGSGKTTCGKALIGMLPASAEITSGILQIGDEPPLPLGDPLLNRQSVSGRRIAMMYQDAASALNPVLTVRAHFHNTLSRHKMGTKAFIERRSTEMLQLLHFEDAARIMDSYPFELSGGMCQRVYLALLLCLEPEILIADEPTSALDMLNRREVLALLNSVRRRFSLSLLFITHDITAAAELGGRIIVLKDGAVVEEGTADEILRYPKKPYTRLLLDARHLPVRDMPMHSRTASPLLQIKGLCKTFKKGSTVLPVLQDIDFELYPGESAGLLGGSGCGKSTLAKCITGLERADRGQIVYHGKDITHICGRKRKWVYSGMQMVFQDARASLNPRRSAVQLVQEPLHYLGIGTRKERIEKAQYYLRLAGLDCSVQNRRPPQLSTGQCQRVVIARALAVEPDLLICDEAVSALDAVLQKHILHLLDTLQKSFGFAVLMISHDMQVVRHYCSKAILISGGRITEYRKPWANDLKVQE